MPARVQSHVAAVLRRTDGTFAPIVSGGAVRPREAVRYSASGIRNQSVHAPEFEVQDAVGVTVFDFITGATLGGDAWVDTVAPAAEGPYVLIVHAQSLPFLPFTHAVRVNFQVSVNAPPPPAPPPSTVNTLVKAAVVVTGVVVGGMLLLQLTRRRSRS